LFGGEGGRNHDDGCRKSGKEMKLEVKKNRIIKGEV